MGEPCFAVRLVEAIEHRSAQEFVTPRGKSCGDHAGLSNVENGVQAGNCLRQLVARRIGVDFLLRNQNHEAHLRGDVAAEIGAVRFCRGETPEGSRRRVIRVTLEIGAEQIEGRRIERPGG